MMICVGVYLRTEPLQYLCDVPQHLMLHMYFMVDHMHRWTSVHSSSDISAFYEAFLLFIGGVYLLLISIEREPLVSVKWCNVNMTQVLAVCHMVKCVHIKHINPDFVWFSFLVCLCVCVHELRLYKRLSIDKGVLPAKTLAREENIMKADIASRGLPAFVTDRCTFYLYFTTCGGQETRCQIDAGTRSCTLWVSVC